MAKVTHADHVRWLQHQYAMTKDAAEREAQRRYDIYPGERVRWGLEDETGGFSVSLVELRAWALASQTTAKREGFDRTAASIQTYIDQINEMVAAGAHSVRVVRDSGIHGVKVPTHNERK